MAVVEEVGETMGSNVPPVTVEELPEAGPSTARGSTDADNGLSSDPTELAASLKAASARLVPDPNDLEFFMFERQAEATLRTLAAGIASPLWSSLSLEDRSAILLPALRLWSSPSPSASFPSSSPTSPLTTLISSLPLSVEDASQISLHLLEADLRSAFTAHPYLSTSSRARARPHGGPAAMDDLHESSGWKVAGIDNAISWCASHLSSAQLERHLSLLLPPTLTMMDDWEPCWRDAGARVLASWVGRVDPAELRRRGLDQLLLATLIHSLSLHHDPPLQHVFPVTLGIVGNMDGEKRADAYAEIVDKGLVAGWTYASVSAVEVLVDVARNAETLCAVLGTGIVRWLKAILPSLLGPLQDPAGQRLPLFRANLAALLTVLTTIRGTGRAAKWRGQILDVTARVWLEVGEHGYSDHGDKAMADEVLTLARKVYTEVAGQCPSVRKDEFAQLVKLSPRFSALVA